MNNIKLSIVLPTFNIEKYIGRCITSCLNQNISTNDYEIIVVNDGSPDKSRDIAATFAEEYNNIKIIDCENGGLSAARNVGLRASTGKYVWFIDPDDWIDDNCLLQLLDRLESDNLDALWISWRRIDEKGNKLAQFKDVRRSDNTVVLTGVAFMENILLFCTFAWSFIFKREVIQDSSFKEGITFEDIEFIPRTLINLERVAFANQTVYNYFWRQDSITNIYNPKKIADLSEAIQTNLLLSIKHPEVLYIKEVIGSLVLTTIRMVSDKRYVNEQKQFLSFLKENGLTKIQYKGIGSRRIMSWLFNRSPFLCMKISSQINRR